MARRSSYIYLDHKSGDAAGRRRRRSPSSASKGVPPSSRRTSTTSARCSPAPRSTRCSRSTAAAARASSARASRTSGAPGRSRRTTRCPACSSTSRRRCPTRRPSGCVGWDIGEPNNTHGQGGHPRRRSPTAGYEFNGLYELVPVGGQDFSQVLPKIKANEPDILLVSNYGQDPGSFANQASTAGLKAIRIGFEFTPDGAERLEGHVRHGRLHVRLRLLRRQEPDQPAGQDVRRASSRREYGEDPDFYAANFYEDAFVMWEVMRRVIKSGGDIRGRRRARQGAAARTSPSSACTAATTTHRRHLHARPERPTR